MTRHKPELVSTIQAPTKRISSSLIEDMLAAVNIVDILEQEYGMVLTPGSKGWYGAQCPFPDHMDKSPSFNANPELGVFKCFGCHRQGNLIKFVRAMEGLSFVEAIQRLGLWSGINEEEGGRDIARTVRDIKAVVQEYLNRQGESQLPGGLSEIQFLLALAKRLRQYELKVNNNPEEIVWVENVYKTIDDLITAENHKEIRKVWSGLAQELPIRLKGANHE